MEPSLTPGCCVDRRWADRHPEHPDARAVRRTACSTETCMTLPPGKTCRDCVHLSRCQALFACSPDSARCDFFPRRFRQKQAS